MTALKRFWRN